MTDQRPHPNGYVDREVGSNQIKRLTVVNGPNQCAERRRATYLSALAIYEPLSKHKAVRPGSARSPEPTVRAICGNLIDDEPGPAEN